jgi:hypothetical protein
MATDVAVVNSNRAQGRRLRALDNAFHTSVKYALRPLDYDQFAEQFPAFTEYRLGDLYEAYKQVRQLPSAGAAAGAWTQICVRIAYSC